MPCETPFKSIHLHAYCLFVLGNVQWLNDCKANGIDQYSFYRVLLSPNWTVFITWWCKQRKWINKWIEYPCTIFLKCASIGCCFDGMNLDQPFIFLLIQHNYLICIIDDNNKHLKKQTQRGATKNDEVIYVGSQIIKLNQIQKMECMEITLKKYKNSQTRMF